MFDEIEIDTKKRFLILMKKMVLMVEDDYYNTCEMILGRKIFMKRTFD